MSLSIPSTSITDGVYKIFNVAYPNQVADLLSPGGADGTIGGYEDNDSSKRNQVCPHSRPYSSLLTIAHGIRFAGLLVGSKE